MVNAHSIKESDLFYKRTVWLYWNVHTKVFIKIVQIFLNFEFTLLKTSLNFWKAPGKEACREVHAG